MFSNKILSEALNDSWRYGSKMWMDWENVGEQISNEMSECAISELKEGKTVKCKDFLLYGAIDK